MLGCVTLAVSTTTVPLDTDPTKAPFTVTVIAVFVGVCIACSEPAMPKRHSGVRRAANVRVNGVPGRKEKGTRRLLARDTRQSKRSTGDLREGSNLPRLLAAGVIEH